jgi:hypothetical protein
MTHPEPRPGWTPPPGTPNVSQADRWGWQRKAVRALADILDAHPDLPPIAWTIGPTGSLAGQVNGLAPAEEVRATFTAWQRALCLENVREVPIRDTGITSLSGKAYHGTIHVAILARVFGPFPDDEPAGTPGAGAGHRPDDPAGRLHRSGLPAVDQRRSTPARQPDHRLAVPLIPPRPSEGPQPTQGL